MLQSISFSVSGCDGHERGVRDSWNSLDSRSESTLCGDTNLLQRLLSGLASSAGNDISSLIDALYHLLLVFQLREFRRDYAQNHVFVLWQVFERLEATSTWSIVL